MNKINSISENKIKTILLVGCTGFLGKCIIFLLLTKTQYNLFIVLRSKNTTNIHNRFKNILNDLNLTENYDNRIKLIQGEYEKESMNIIIDNKAKDDIIDNVSCLINALADINFSRPIRKAVQNNTVTALKWLELIYNCKQPCKYIYISTAYVNYHLNQSNIEEKIYETTMNQNTLTNILNGKTTNIKPYYNSYTYSKQLAEILLTNNRNNITLHIIRPSIICPAYQYPYCGYGELQNISLLFFGTMTGTLIFLDLDLNTIANSIIPVDLIAERCVMKITDENNYTLEHTSYNQQVVTCNEIHAIKNKFFKNTLMDNLIINGTTYTPFNPIITSNRFYQFVYIIYFIIIQLLNRSSFIYIYKSLIFTYNFRFLTDFLKKDIIFYTKHKYESHDIVTIFPNLS